MSRLFSCLKASSSNKTQFYKPKSEETKNGVKIKKSMLQENELYGSPENLSPLKFSQLIKKEKFDNGKNIQQRKDLYLSCQPNMPDFQTKIKPDLKIVDYTLKSSIVQEFVKFIDDGTELGQLQAIIPTTKDLKEKYTLHFHKSHLTIANTTEMIDERTPKVKIYTQNAHNIEQAIEEAENKGYLQKSPSPTTEASSSTPYHDSQGWDDTEFQKQTVEDWQKGLL